MPHPRCGSHLRSHDHPTLWLTAAMAEPLKNHFGPEMVHRAASSLVAVHPAFDVAGFAGRALDGFEELELTPRARRIAEAMAEFLPADRATAVEILIASLGPELENCDPADAVAPDDGAAGETNPMAGFFYMPHGYFLEQLGGEVADAEGAGGDELFDLILRANYEITKRFTAEFSIRTPLRDRPERTLAVLRGWATDPNVHVRRLVSEGTRTRLPWSFRLPEFQREPAPVIELLELLKDDPVEYVRRSVANNLNDIAKDHPDVVVEVARRWWADGDRNRRRLVRHALRTLIKAGDPDALDVLGYGANSPARVAGVSIDPASVEIGGKVRVEVAIENPGGAGAGALIDLRVHFVKANGSTSPKVFKGAELDLEPGESSVVRKTISVAQHTTRTHYPGEHVVEALVNGAVVPLGVFIILD